MAKYSRYDPRNKKSNRHKNQYLGRSQTGVKNRARYDGDIYEHDMYKKYGLQIRQ